MNDEDGKNLAETLRALSEADHWAARTSAEATRLRPAPRSSLRGDDDRAFPYALSHAVWDALDHAVDHLTCLLALLRDAKVINRFAPYALVRGALENACAAVWILEPPRRADRLARSGDAPDLIPVTRLSRCARDHACVQFVNLPSMAG
jgi:hypothetical protein